MAKTKTKLMTREEIDLRCSGCDQAVNAVGCGMPSIKNKACMLAPVEDKANNDEKYGRIYRSIYAVRRCPAGERKGLK
ncbi:MAG: hypothetical protein ABFD64_02805 [Armatimonadota bacterium]